MRFCEAAGCNYPVFSTDKKTRKGYCKFHAPIFRTDLDRRSIIQKAISKQEKAKVRSLHSLPQNIEIAEEKSALKEWFKYHMINSQRICENCSADLSGYNDADWKACQHHIIEKSPTNGCPSVASVLENHGVLCKWGKGNNGGCHSLWHSSNLVASKMPFFTIAKARFEKFKHLIVESEQKKIPEIFLSEIK